MTKLQLIVESVKNKYDYGVLQESASVSPAVTKRKQVLVQEAANAVYLTLLEALDAEAQEQVQAMIIDELNKRGLGTPVDNSKITVDGDPAADLAPTAAGLAPTATSLASKLA